MKDLAAPTDPAWVDLALAHLDEVLLDHAHCEKKAAGAALNLVFRYPEHAWLQAPLSRLAREELAHFERVLALLERRGVPFARQKPSPYGGKLQALVRSPEPDQLVDRLLVAALIEARSCERMQLLAETASDAEIAELYRDLLASEARHHRSYVELAERAGEPASVHARLAELAAEEARILAEPTGVVRLHT